MITFAERTDTDAQAVARFEHLVALTPSAKLVFFVLQEEGPLTQSRLAEQTLLSQRTIRSAITSLEQADLVDEQPYLRDARKKVYQAKQVARRTETPRAEEES